MAIKNTFAEEKITSECLHRHAISLLNELDNEQDKVCSVAAAGRAYLAERNLNGGPIFSVIEQLCEDCSMISTLRKLVAELSARAGSTWIGEAAE